MENTSLVNKILIVVRGGEIQGVFSNDPNIEVDILDYDHEDFIDDKQALKSFLERKKELQEVV